MAKANLENEKFGIEIEVAGQTRAKIAQAVKEAVNGTITARNTGAYDATVITDRQGRNWKVQNDASITKVNGHIGSEIVSPVLVYPNDIQTLEAVIRKVRETGAQPHSSCGIHIHIDGAKHTVKSLSHLAKMVYKNEELIFQALNVSSNRKARFAKPVEEKFIEKLVKDKPDNKRDLNEAWYGQYTSYHQHYHQSRYHGLNFHNIWGSLETIEFRYFNSSLNCLRVIPWIQLCIALSVKARNCKSASHHKIETDNPKFNFRVWLVSGLGMVGNEFKNARNTLLQNLPGNSAWR